MFLKKIGFKKHIKVVSDTYKGFFGGVVDP